MKTKEYISPIIDEIFDSISKEEFEKKEKMMRLGNKIEQAMLLKGWSRKELAEKMNKRPSEITRWLCGSHNFTVDTLLDIEYILGIKLVNFERIANTKSTRKTLKANPSKMLIA